MIKLSKILLEEPVAQAAAKSIVLSSPAVAVGKSDTST